MKIFDNLDVETDLIDIADLSIADLQVLDGSQLAASTARVVHQVERPRTNLGGTGPPGRAD